MTHPKEVFKVIRGLPEVMQAMEAMEAMIQAAKMKVVAEDYRPTS